MRRDPVFWLSAAALGVILLAAVFAERLAPFGPNEQDITQAPARRPASTAATSSARTRWAATS